MENENSDSHNLYDNRIEDYLYNRMTPSELKSFKEDLNADPILAENFKIAQALRYIYIKQRVKEIHTKLEESGELQFNNPEGGEAAEDGTLKENTLFKYILPLAAMVTFIVGVGYYVLNSRGNKVELSNQLLTNYIQEPLLNDNQVPKEWTVAYNDLKREKINIAIEKLQYPFISEVKQGEVLLGASKNEHSNRLIDTKLEDYRHLYLGICYLKSNDSKRAVEHFNHIASTQVVEKSRWYKALGFLKINNSQAGINLLNEISKDKKNLFSAKATLLLDTIE